MQSQNTGGRREESASKKMKTVPSVDKVMGRLVRRAIIALLLGMLIISLESFLLIEIWFFFRTTYF